MSDQSTGEGVTQSASPRAQAFQLGALILWFGVVMTLPAVIDRLGLPKSVEFVLIAILAVLVLLFTVPIIDRTTKRLA